MAGGLAVEPRRVDLGVAQVVARIAEVRRRVVGPRRREPERRPRGVHPPPPPTGRRARRDALRPPPGPSRPRPGGGRGPRYLVAVDARRRGEQAVRERHVVTWVEVDVRRPRRRRGATRLLAVVAAAAVT